MGPLGWDLKCYNNLPMCKVPISLARDAMKENGANSYMNEYSYVKLKMLLSSLYDALTACSIMILWHNYIWVQNVFYRSH